MKSRIWFQRPSTFREVFLIWTFEPVEKFLIRIFVSLTISLSLKCWYLLSPFSFILYHQGLRTLYPSYMNFKHICYLYFNSMAHLPNHSDSKPAELLKKYTLFQNKMSSSPISFWLYLFFWFLQKKILLSISTKHICPWNTFLPFFIAFNTYKIW